MSRKSQSGATDAFEEIQSGADRLAEWTQGHLMLVVGTLVVVLGVVGAFQLSLTLGERRENAASSALAAVQADYLDAMGAQPGSLEVPELANPEAARQIHADFAERFEEVADAHSGTVSGALARLEAGNQLVEAGAPQRAQEVWQELLAQAPRKDSLRGLILQRLANADEDAGRWREAGARHEEASALSGFPLRHWALADAARCFAAAGDKERALALYDQLQSVAPELQLPEHQREQRDMLQAAVDG
ncbi:MAG TPA: hypothetical protein VIY27_08750 [Myxococcota bacterium]